MNFATLSPEVNSGRMYAGPGAGPMRAAAAAWDGLAVELHSTAAGYQSVITGLNSEWWLGPSSALMTQAVSPYLVWLTSTATQVEQTATQAKAAAAAYETAFAMTVPPTVIAANRARLLALVATNMLGQNTAAIAATEAHYGEMWAQDATAMYGYAASAATAAEVTPFTAPQRTSNPAGQAAAVAQATGGSAGTGTQTVLSQLTAPLAGALHGLAAPMQSAPAAMAAPLQPVPPVLPLELPGLADLVGLDALGSIGVGVSAGAWAAGEEGTQAILTAEKHLHDVQIEILDHVDNPRMQLPGVLASAGSGGAGAGPVRVSAGIGQAVSAGGLSVPPSWAAAAPEIRTVASALPATSVGAAPAALAGASGTAFSEMALAGMAGRALAGTVSPGSRDRVEAATGEPPKSPLRPAPQLPPASPVTGIAAELREFAELHDAGVLTDKEFNAQKQRLLGPGG